MKKTLWILLSTLVVLAFALSACGPKATPTAAPATQAPATQAPATVAPATQAPTQPVERHLQIYHWWTAPGEREAADAMFAALKKAYPDIVVDENPSPGGGGVNQRVVLQSRIAAGDYPDTFQTLGGAELKNYVDSGVLQPLDDFYKETGYDKVIPGPLLKAVTVNGHPYVVPLNMHIQNILYYNKKLFDELKLNAPTTFDELIAACDAIKAAKPEMVCMSLGSKEKWEVAFVFDSIYLELAGPENYVKLYKGEIDVTQDANYKTALERLAKLIPYMNSDHASLTWDQAVGLVGSEKAAMNLMGTWAIGAFVKGSNWQPGVDFGAVTFPQKPDRILLFHPDTYGITAKAPNPSATMDWLKVVASPELQIPTDVIQGGLFARIDIDPKEFPDPIRQEMQQFVRDNPGKLILDQHGSILPAAAQSAYWDILSAFLATQDVDGTIKAVANMMTTYDVKNGSAWYQWP